MDQVTVLLTNATGTVVTNPVTTYTSATLELKFNETGSGELLAPADDWLVEAATTPGNRVVLVKAGTVFGGGPIEKPGAIEWGPEGGVGNLRINFATFEAYLGDRLTYPNPALAATDALQPLAYTASAVNAETVLRNLVNLNAGPGAIVARQVPNLTLGAVATVGANVTLSTRFEILTDVLRAVAIAGGGLGWRVVQDGTALEFEVYAPVDRSIDVRFSRSLGNLRALRTDPSAPTGTVAIIGGDGTGDTRTINERSNATGVTLWGRKEIWVNQGGSGATSTELNQAGDVALIEADEVTGIEATAVDTLWARYGTDYFLGDKVGIELVPGSAVADYVTAVTLTATPAGGAVVSPTIGTERSGPTQARQLRELVKRVGRLERT